jgi:hypothetical protein
MTLANLSADARRSVVVDAIDRFALPDDGTGKIVYDREEGSSIGWFDRLFMGWENGLAFNYSDWEARDLAEMLKRDYKARQVEAVLTYPTMAAERTISAAPGGEREFEFVKNFWDADPFNGGCLTPLDRIIDQMTSSVVYKKAFWELVWTRGRGDFAGKSVYKSVSWRPQTTTRSLHHPRNGTLLGFRQEPYVVGPGITQGMYPIEIINTKGKAPRSFVHVHGARRDPINGLSDLEVAYWAYKTKQKVLFLMFNFLENVSGPKGAVYAQDQGIAQKIANAIAKTKPGGLTPIEVDGNPQNVKIDTIDFSGRGAEQFMEFIKWLDACGPEAVMAGFLGLSGQATDGKGSLALSADASDFFLMTLESKNREYEYSTRLGLFAPLVRYNFGPSAKVPMFKFEPLNAEDKSALVSMVQAVVAGRDPALIPDDFIKFLVERCVDYFGGDGKKLAEAFTGAAEKARQQALALNPLGAMSPQGQGIARVAGATGAATRAVAAAKAGQNPVKAASGAR